MFPSVCHWQKERSVMFENKVFICLKKKYVCQIFPDKEHMAKFLSNLWMIEEEILLLLKKHEQVGENQK